MTDDATTAGPGDIEFHGAAPVANWQAGPGWQPAPTAPRPGRTLGIVGFVLSFIWVVDIAGLVISIIAMVKSKRAGQKNGFALAGIIISIAGILVWGSIVAVAVPSLVHAGQMCAQLGNGVHVVGNTTYTCTPTSFNESTHF
ncbi:MAG TPA: DUF4190 domain-containing protein [Galbitalea sp.]|jgi:hypothetical protein